MSPAYRAATESAAVFARPDRVRMRVVGRAPGRMLTGIVSGSMPPPLAPGADAIVACVAPPSLVLTPKGRIVAELRLLRIGDGEEGSFLLELPRVAMDGLVEHFRRYLPPRFARVEDVSGETGMISVIGPAAAEALARAVDVGGIDADLLAGLTEGEERIVPRAPEHDGADGVGALRIVRAGDAPPPAFDVVGDTETVETVRTRLVEAGAVPGADGELEVLRIEKGRPAFGAEVDDGVLPAEAGLQDRAIDHRKGCYTGQEVVVRVRDRGRVNRHLRGLLLGDVPPPAPGTPLFADDLDRAVGEVRSASASPRFGQTIGLGYVRREVTPPAAVRLGSPEGPPVGVRGLSDDGWVPGDGVPGAP